MDFHSYKEKAILRKLSEDSSASMEELSKAAKCSRATAYKILSDLEEKLKIRYTLELDEDKIGITQRHVLVVKFNNEKPSKEFIQKLFENDLYVSNAYICEGDFDLIIHVRSNDPMNYIVWESKLPGYFADFEPRIYPSELMLTNFGYLPINPEQISLSNLNEKDKAILKELTSNSRQSISELSKKIGISRTTIEYRLYMLKKEGIIKRFTISINKPYKNYILAYFVNYIFTKDSPARSIKMMEYYKSYDEELPFMNTFQLLAPMSGSYRFFGVGLFENEKDAIENAVKPHISIFDKEHVRMKRAAIIDIAKGSYPFRNIDIRSNYTRFQWGKPYTN